MVIKRVESSPIQTVPSPPPPPQMLGVGVGGWHWVSQGGVGGMGVPRCFVGALLLCPGG